MQDGIDKCCKQHDNCYSHSGCPAYLEYFVPYLWKCYKGTPLCGKLYHQAIYLSLLVPVPVPVGAISLQSVTNYAVNVLN